jgi:hypothetical protein
MRIRRLRDKEVRTMSRKVGMVGFSLAAWEDAYFDGLLDPSENTFCEEMQEVYGLDGWDSYDEVDENMGDNLEDDDEF